MDCMNTTKLLARAETAILYTRFFLNNAKEGKSKPASVDVVAGISTAGRLLSAKSTWMPNTLEPMKPFHAVSRACDPITKDIEKLKRITRKEANELLPRVDRVVKKFEALWTEVQNGACREDAAKEKKEEAVRKKKLDRMVERSKRAYARSEKKAKR